ncbi:MAG: YqgE/AlgH family protein [Rhizobiales bacterium]|nr:YqgE/AlgH family protein [Hyphomicrobiales bacterium]NRB13521.1 YqgE/AlgH family protein [Hyphomicrobiales bacterium]
MDLSNKLLVALPNILDPRFAKAVIYICSHNENGCLGLTINAPSQNLTVGDTLSQLNLPEFDIDALIDGDGNNSKLANSTIEMPPHLFQIPVLNGGPVEHNRGFVLHSKDYELAGQTLKISNSISMTSTADILSDISRGRGPKKICFAIGYVGWRADQLEKEISENAWLVIDADDDIVFNHEFDKKYEMTMQLIGIPPEMVSSISSASGRA